MHVFGRLRNRRTRDANQDRIARDATLRRDQAKNLQGLSARVR